MTWSILSCLLVVFAASAGSVSAFGSERIASEAVFSSERIDAQIGQGDAAMESMLGPYRERMIAYSSEVICQAAEPLSGKRPPESALGNVMCAALLSASSAEFGKAADFALTNFGGLRRDLPAGPITVGLLTELSPFDNFLVLLELRGDSVLRLANAIARNGGEPVAGLSFGIGPDGNAVDPKINGKPIDPRRIYRLATIDYLADSSRFYFPEGSVLKRETAGITQREALIAHLRKMAKRGVALSNKIEGRIYHAK